MLWCHPCAKRMETVRSLHCQALFAQRYVLGMGACIAISLVACVARGQPSSWQEGGRLSSPGPRGSSSAGGQGNIPKVRKNEAHRTVELRGTERKGERKVAGWSCLQSWLAIRARSGRLVPSRQATFNRGAYRRQPLSRHAPRCSCRRSALLLGRRCSASDVDVVLARVDLGQLALGELLWQQWQEQCERSHTES